MRSFEQMACLQVLDLTIVAIHAEAVVDDEVIPQDIWLPVLQQCPKLRELILDLP